MGKVERATSNKASASLEKDIRDIVGEIREGLSLSSLFFFSCTSGGTLVTA